MTRAVVLNSGGMDSTTAVAWARERHNEIRTISFDYGQKHRRELQSAIQVAANYNVRHDIVDLKSVTQLISTSALTSNAEVPEGHYEEETMKQTVVPNRNAMMANIAIAVGVSWGAEEVVLGVHAGDHAVYPDCRPQFVNALNSLARIANEGFITKEFGVIAPFVTWTKAQIAKWGVQHNVPYELTWTCYKGGEKHCGRCSTCCERLEAFHIAGYTDPVTYSDRTYWREVCNVVD